LPPLAPAEPPPAAEDEAEAPCPGEPGEVGPFGVQPKIRFRLATEGDRVGEVKMRGLGATEGKQVSGSELTSETRKEKKQEENRGWTGKVVGSPKEDLTDEDPRRHRKGLSRRAHDNS